MGRETRAMQSKFCLSGGKEFLLLKEQDLITCFLSDPMASTERAIDRESRIVGSRTIITTV